ncbi:MAG: Asp23/Gls24 family envelope stress response protein [Lachnospiraceae bacterium]|nr:Asp23/Gls24 family envelope stress response protein [Lachnospiraceae bacterium]
MRAKMNTDLGNISLDTEAIAQVAGTEAMECFGVVGMATYSVRDGLVRLLKKESLSHGINVDIVDNKINLDFHVIIAYGVSIKAVCDNLMSNVKYRVEEFSGMEVGRINVFIEGVRVID